MFAIDWTADAIRVRVLVPIGVGFSSFQYRLSDSKLSKVQSPN